MTTTTIVENFPGYPEGVAPFQMMDDLRRQAERFGTLFVEGVVTKVDFSTTPKKVWLEDGKEMDAETVIIATGASAKFLGIPSEEEYKGRGVSAVKSILQLEGVTSNSLEVADRCLSMTNVQARMERENLCLFMLDGFANAHSNSGVRNDVERCVLCFARRSGLYNEHFDGCLSVRIPGYQFSKRRLNVLRDAERNMIIRFNKAFITNAINELVSYPEADLPE